MLYQYILPIRQLPKPNTRTQQEEVDALLDEIRDEVHIDSKYAVDPSRDIQERLQRLKGTGGMLTKSVLHYILHSIDKL